MNLSHHCVFNLCVTEMMMCCMYQREIHLLVSVVNCRRVISCQCQHGFKHSCFYDNRPSEWREGHMWPARRAHWLAHPQHWWTSLYHHQVCVLSTMSLSVNAVQDDVCWTGCVLCSGALWSARSPRVCSLICSAKKVSKLITFHFYFTGVKLTLS